MNPIKKTWLDRAIEYASPSAALRRYRSRAQINFAFRGYEAASKGDRTFGWKRSPKDAASEIAVAKKPVRENARDLARNNPFAVSALDGLSSNVIGTGIETVFKNRDGSTNKALTEQFARWAGSTRADAVNTSTYYGIQELVFRSVVEGGEALVLPIIEGGKDARFCLKALEPDFIDDFRTGYFGRPTEKVIDGILLGEGGKKVGIYLFEEHPGSLNYGLHAKTFISKLHPIEDVLQIYRMERIGQLRGMSWFSPVITLLKELDGFFDATILKQKIAAAFAGYIKNSDVVTTGLGAAVKRPIPETIDSGAIDILPDGMEIQFPSPPAANDFDPFTRAILRAYSSGMKVPYEVVTGDLSGVNFSSGRMGWQEFGRKIDQWQWNMLVPMLCEPVAWRWLQFQAVNGAMTNGVYPTFVMPKRQMVDPVSETNATVAQIRNGLKSLPEAIREQGYDPIEKLKEIAEFNKSMDEYGVVFDSDARKTTKSGITQSAESNPVDSGEGASKP